MVDEWRWDETLYRGSAAYYSERSRDIALDVWRP
jgi:hypothetical protein